MFRKLSLVFLLSLLWFALFQSWGNFRDPDAFYHAKMAEILREHGPIQHFPWLNLTSLGDIYADQHFLFHVLTVPVQIATDRFMSWRGIHDQALISLYAQQLAGILFAALFAVFSFLFFTLLKLPRPWLWTALLISTAPLLLRLSFAKGSALALIWFMMGIVGTLLSFPKNPLSLTKERGQGVRWYPACLFLSGLGFALSHGGWPILLGCQCLMIVGFIIFERFISDSSWRDLRRSTFHATRYTILLTSLGILLGLLLHPNFPNIFSLLWIQIIKIGVLTSSRVLLGSEWSPYAPMDLLQNILGLAFASLVILFGFIFALKKPINLLRARDVLMILFPFAALLAWTLKSQRMIEYFVPVFVITLALAADMIDWKHARQEITSKKVFMLIKILLIIVIAEQIQGSYTFMHVGKGRSFGFLSGAMNYLNLHAQPGDKIFHLD